MDLFYYVVLVGSLIFVHELGHFLFAKAFGVKVLTFSLGFGPKVLRLRGRETEYCVSLLPFGGYVKMLEAARSDIVLPEDRKRTFESLALYKRIIVALAGPTMNLVFPVLLYFAVFVSEGPFSPPTIGVVLPDHAADGRLLPGDRVMAVNGRDIGTFEELTREIARNPGKTLIFRVFRNQRHVDVEIVVEDAVERREFDIVEHVGKIGIGTRAPAAVIGIPRADSPAYRAGLRTFDLITHVAGRPVRRYIDLAEALSESGGETMPVTYLRPFKVSGALGGLAEMAVLEAGVVALTPDATGTTTLERTGIEQADLYVSQIPEDSYLYKAGLRPGDKILRLDDKPVRAWSVFRERVLGDPGSPHRVDFLRALDGKERSGAFHLESLSGQDESIAQALLRVQNWAPLAPEEAVEHPTPIRYAWTKAVDKTIGVTEFLLVGIVRLVQGRISLESLSGPITIYEVAGQEGRKGADHFIWLMALISINLGLLNLLPIPVLDGGHLMFFAIEAILRRPVPLRVREIAHIVGMAILLGLIFIAFKNDLERRWDVISLEMKGFLN